MQVAVVTIFPEMFAAICDYGITGRAIKQGLLDFKCFNPRDYSEDKHKAVDDRPYGGGPGMVMTVGPLQRATQDAYHWLEQAREEITVVYLTPQGQTLDQGAVEIIGQCKKLVLIAGRYEGIDKRFIDAEVDQEWSIGDYVLSGGELPVMVLLDAMIRQLPGALGDPESAQQDSFASGLLDCPHYSRPKEYQGVSVPEVLLSGDHQAIANWRLKQALGRTWQRRPDLLAKMTLNAVEQKLLAEFQAEQKIDRSSDMSDK